MVEIHVVPGLGASESKSFECVAFIGSLSRNHSSKHFHAGSVDFGGPGGEYSLVVLGELLEDAGTIFEAFVFVISGYSNPVGGLEYTFQVHWAFPNSMALNKGSLKISNFAQVSVGFGVLRLVLIRVRHTDLCIRISNSILVEPVSHRGRNVHNVVISV